ncbi:MAG: ABC transporter ATP-binding protein [Motiliproteus sp.]
MSLLTTAQLQVNMGERILCSDLDLDMKPGQVWGLLGGNGSGKTTLLHTLAGLRDSKYGSVALFGQPMASLKNRERAKKLGVLLQDDQVSFPSTVLESVLMGRHPHLAPWCWESAEDRAIAQQALRQVELLAMQDRQIDELSGGERQRLKIATLMVQSPTVWLLDEPTNHLDLNHRIQLLSLLVAKVKEQQGCLMMSLHDLQLASRFCDNLVMMFPDGSTEQGSQQSLLQPERLTRLYQYPIQRIETEAGAVFIPQ